MKIHEYQAKDLLATYGVAVPSGKLATTIDEVAQAAKDYGPCVLKAQVHSGARGKAGGVKFVHNVEEAKEVASKMFGMKLVTRQTGPEGKIVKKILVSQAIDVKREFYLSITTSSETAGLVIVASADGGMVSGFRTYEGIQVAKALGLSGDLQKELLSMLRAFYKLYMDKDCSLIEINPLVETAQGHLLCLDAKVNFDDNALFRHPDIVELRDIEQEDSKEYQASLYDLNYVSLEGDIGCLVNGAGLAMATMDIIKNFGGSPANFLDVGGSATTERVKAAFEILLSDPNVKVIFINIFGGIMKCDIIAQGVVEAAKEIGIKIPIVVRLEGTNVQKGEEIIKNSQISIIQATDMADGARKAIEAAKAGRS